LFIDSIINLRLILFKCPIYKKIKLDYKEIQMKFFDDFLLYLKTVDPELKKEKIKPLLREMLKKTIEFNVNDWINHMIESTRKYPLINLELDHLKNSIEEQKKAYLKEHTDYSYLQILRGKIAPQEQVYNRELIPYPNQFYAIFWSMEKANKLIKEKSKKKEYISIKSMNIDVDELNNEYLAQAIHNKKPAILIEFEPYQNLSYGRFLIDGNHRAYSNSFKKDVYPTFILNSEEQMSVMVHPFFQYHYLLHVIFKLLQTHKGDVNSMILDPTSRYNILKEIIAKK
jgi:hypothetical protein